MTMAVKEEKRMKNVEQQEETRNLIADGLRDMITGNVKDFDCVFDRLEKKYLQD